MLYFVPARADYATFLSVPFFKELQPDFWCKGADYTLETLNKKELKAKGRAKIKFIPFVDNISTTGIIEKIDDVGLGVLDKDPNFEYQVIENVSKENLIKELPKFHGITLRVAKLDEDILSKCNKLKVISRHGVGYDNVDTNYLKKSILILFAMVNYNSMQQ